MKKFNIIVVISTWSSGSTAITGFLHHCGAYTCPPHQKTNDALTPNAFEPALYTDALRKLFDEFSFQKKGNYDQFKLFFEDFYKSEVKKAKQLGFQAIALKCPLQTLILPYLKNFLQPKFVFVTRPIKNIEATRVRRKWHPVYGEQGAKRIYSMATNFLISNSCTYLSIPYNVMMDEIDTRKTLVDFCNLTPSNEMMKKAEQFLKR